MGIRFLSEGVAEFVPVRDGLAVGTNLLAGGTSAKREEHA
jgi:hypothetical protein